MDKLTKYYGVWNSDKETKSLIDGKYRGIDYYDFWFASTTTEYDPKISTVVEQLHKDQDYIEGKTPLFLAMSSLVKERRIENDVLHIHQLYKDFEREEIYTIELLDRWRDGGNFNIIWRYFDYKANWINYYILGNKEIETIKEAATKIDKKYNSHELNDELIAELADDFDSHYLPQLYDCLIILKKGIEGLNLKVLALIICSLFFGVLIPFLLLIFLSDEMSGLISFITATNVGLIAYFIIKFPFIIRRELKWT